LFIAEREKRGRNGIAFVVPKIVRTSTVGFLPISTITSQLRIKECFYSRNIINVCAPTEIAVQEGTEIFMEICLIL
jgi:hypothetical protein